MTWVGKISLEVPKAELSVPTLCQTLESCYRSRHFHPCFRHPLAPTLLFRWTPRSALSRVPATSVNRMLPFNPGFQTPLLLPLPSPQQQQPGARLNP